MRSSLKHWAVYGALLGAVVLAFGVIQALGEQSGLTGLRAPGAAAPQADSGGERLTQLLISLVVVIAAARALAALFRRFGQPPVIGEVIAGILLGPSALGAIFPAATHFVLPAEVAPFLGVFAQIGIILYMFIVGLELDTGVLRQRANASVAISHASITVPFVLGAALSLWLFRDYAGPRASFTLFSLFLGISMSVTAFPVLARILGDFKLTQTRLGSIALACAAVDDVTAWCLLALVVGVAQSQPERAFLTVGLTVAFILLMVIGVRRGVVWWVRQHSLGRWSTSTHLTIACVALLLCSLATERIGIHALFGAFLLGALVPHDSGLAAELKAKLEDIVLVLFLPGFFAFTGLRTELGLVHGTEWLVCLAIIAVASLGKFGGSTVAARLTGLGWRDSAAIGVLMNTRGLMELIVLNVGLDLGVLSPRLFSMMVVMAVVTTLITSPVLRRLVPAREA